ncbi:geranylgeranyl pyrophosphate synthase [Solibacillus sp. CAU 1738]|uniref:geranylgeranyl pyrophosphate synthase n=1 Tax=Solibacillus sp. CAU 1738 TaxID=3140363 RepID=UPI003260EAEC
MNKQIEINIPEWFELDGLSTLQVVISPNTDNVGIILAGENLDLTKTCCPTIRMYLVNLINGKYELTKELEAFTFNSKEEALQFSEKLPELTAIDLVMMLNNQTPVFAMS